MLMNASLQMLVDQIMCVTTLLDRTDVNVHWDILVILAHGINLIQCVLVRILSYISVGYSLSVIYQEVSVYFLLTKY